MEEEKNALQGEYMDGTLKRLQYAGQVYDNAELEALQYCVKSLRIASGPYVKSFEDKMAARLGASCIAVNSGSSANLLAISALTSKKLGELRLLPGDEVITVACCFPTTIAPMVQNGLVPVFVDIDIPTYNVNIASMRNALTDKTRAVVLAHTLGNPFNVKEVVNFCVANDLWLIEDNCDSLGALYNGKPTGTFGDISTMSFYPPHHITTGEGGMVATRSHTLKTVIKSLRDWGRDCHCEPGEDDNCRSRFSHQLGSLPKGYDHKYTYSHLGYNLKMVEPCGALGVVQLDKIDGFIEKRRHNWSRLRDGLLSEGMDSYFVLPEAEENSTPSWFSFMLTCRNGVDKNKVVNKLEFSHGIQTRPLFTGNITKHPCMDGVNYKVHGSLSNSDTVMERGFMVGVYPGLNDSDIDYMIDALVKAR